jgi:hypothetical protein
MREPSKPDINKGHVCLLAAGALFHFADTTYRLADNALTEACLVPANDKTPEGAWPRDREIQVGLDLQVGTIDELVERFREGLTQAFARMTDPKILPFRSAVQACAVGLAGRPTHPPLGGAWLQGKSASARAEVSPP